MVWGIPHARMAGYAGAGLSSSFRGSVACDNTVEPGAIEQEDNVTRSQEVYLLASLLSPRDLSSLKQHMTATGTTIRDRPTSSTILQSGACSIC